VFYSVVQVEMGIQSNVTVAQGSVAENQGLAYFDFQVEKPVAPIPGSGSPRYPQVLLSAGVEGQVLGQFVVDTLGRVELGSFKVIRSDHDLFTAAVRSALPAMRFLPAEVGGRKVKHISGSVRPISATGIECSNQQVLNDTFFDTANPNAKFSVV